MRRVLALLLAFTAVLGAQGASKAIVIKAARVITIESEELSPGEVLIRDGRFVEAGAKVEVPAGADVLEFKDGVVFPGFVDGGCFAGVRRNRDETTRALNPDLEVADAIDASDPVFERAARAGITTLQVMPGNADPVGGWTAVIKARDGRIDWLSRTAGLKLSFVQSSYTPNRDPTSFLGAASSIERLAPPRRMSPESVLFVAADRRAEIQVAAASRFGRKPVLMTGAKSKDAAAEIAQSARGAILVPLTPDLPDRDRKVAAALAAAGVPLGFSSETPSCPPEALRLSAIIAAAGGLSRKDAHLALTLGCARLLGADQRVGSIAKGKDADLVVLTHDPLDPRARILLVLQDGKIVFRPKE